MVKALALVFILSLVSLLIEGDRLMRFLGLDKERHETYEPPEYARIHFFLISALCSGAVMSVLIFVGVGDGT